MALTFQREQYTEAFGQEVQPLAEMHNKEIGGVLSDLSVRVPQEMYEQFQATGVLRLYTLREDGEVKGYNTFMVMQHPEYGLPMAQHDAMFLHPSVRVGFNAIKFLRWCDEQLKADGVAVVTQHVTAALDFGAMLRRAGYRHHETIYIKRLN